MCWNVKEMKALGREYPELGKLAARDAKRFRHSMEEEWDALGESAGMWYDFGKEDFRNFVSRKKVATDLIGFLRQEEERR